MSLLYGHETLQIINRAAPQDPNEDLSPEAITTLADTLAEIKGEINSLRTEERSLKAKLAALLGTQTTSELRDSIAAREAELTQLRARLEPLRSGTVAPVNVEVKVKVDGELARWEAAAKGRKKIRDEMWAFIKDALPDDVNAEEVKVWCRSSLLFCCAAFVPLDRESSKYGLICL